MQNAAIQHLGLDGAYLALPTQASEVEGLIRGIAHAGGGGNVTLPHKELAARVVEEPSGDVVRTGACNTFWMEDGVIRGDNTDVVGVRQAVESLLGASPEGARILLLGAGGAARGAAVGMLDANPEVLAIRNRTRTRGEALADFLGDPRVQVLDPEPEEHEVWDLVVQGTRLGLQASDPLPIDPRPGHVGAVLDLVYGQHGTPLVERARSRGIPAADGTEMLLRQGMASFERWWRCPAPEAVMRAALADGWV
jgi:shikimate dehydrogenase